MPGDDQSYGTAIDPESGDPSPADDFLCLCCEKFRCPRQAYEKLVFLECVCPEGLEFARIIRLLYPGFFRSDLDLIDQIKHATSFAEVQKLVDFHGAQNATGGLLRSIFKVRLSKQRILNLARTLFPKPA